MPPRRARGADASLGNNLSGVLISRFTSTRCTFTLLLPSYLHGLTSSTALLTRPLYRRFPSSCSAWSTYIIFSPFLFLLHIFICLPFLHSSTEASFHFSIAEVLADVRANFPKWSGDARKANRCQWASQLSAAKRL